MFQRRIWAPTLVVFVSACTSIPPDRGMGEVSELLNSRSGITFSENATGEAKGTDPVSDWLADELTADAAVRIALVNNPRLRLAYARLGIAAVDLYDAARLSNPRVSFSMLDSSASGAAAQLTLGLVQNFADLILLQPRKRLATADAERIKFIVAADLFSFSQDVIGAYFKYLAAEQNAVLRDLTAETSELTAALAQQYFVSGNINRLAFNLFESEAAKTQLTAAKAAADLAAARISLNQLLGLTSTRPWRARAGLPFPVTHEDGLPSLQNLALTQRLDLKAATLAVVRNDNALEMAQRYRYLGDFEAGVEYEHETEHSRLLGPTFALELPIFNQGDGQILRAQAILEHDQAALAALEVAINNGIALAHNQVMSARHRFEVLQTRFVPAHQSIVARTQELQTYMIVSPFELLRAKQNEYDAFAGSIDSLRDYWLARTELSREVGAHLPSTIIESEKRLDIGALLQPKSTDHLHNQSTLGDPTHVMGEHE